MAPPHGSQGCCGGTYVAISSKQTCCGDRVQTVEDDDGVLQGMCCDDDGQLNATWGSLADVMTKTPGASPGSNDAIWRINQVCGCGNTWINVSEGFAAPQDMRSFTNQFVCTDGKNAVEPCAAALAGFLLTSSQVGCCHGQEHLNDNSRCLGVFSDRNIIDSSAGKTLSKVGPNYNGVSLRQNFVPGGLYLFQPLSSTSQHFYNTQAEVADAYCGASAASMATPSPFITASGRGCLRPWAAVVVTGAYALSLLAFWG